MPQVGNITFSDSDLLINFSILQSNSVFLTGRLWAVPASSPLFAYLRSGHRGNRSTTDVLFSSAKLTDSFWLMWRCSSSFLRSCWMMNLLNQPPYREMHLYLGYLCFCHKPNLPIRDDGQSLYRILNQELCVAAQFFSQQRSTSIPADQTPIHASVTCSILPLFITKTKRLSLLLEADSVPWPRGSSVLYLFLSCGADRHTSHVAFSTPFSCKAENYRPLLGGTLSSILFPKDCDRHTGLPLCRCAAPVLNATLKWSVNHDSLKITKAKM